MGTDLTGESIRPSYVPPEDYAAAATRTRRVAAVDGWDAATVLDMLGIGGAA